MPYRRRDGKQHVIVSIPEGAVPGQTMQATSPEGFNFAFQVPAGVGPGGLIQVEIPQALQQQRRLIQVKVPEGVIAGQEIQSPGLCPQRDEVQVLRAQRSSRHAPPPDQISELTGATAGGTIFVMLPEQQQSAESMAGGQLSVVIPPDAKPGQRLQALAPDGSSFFFEVPSQVSPQHTIIVTLPPKNNQPNQNQNHNHNHHSQQPQQQNPPIAASVRGTSNAQEGESSSWTDDYLHDLPVCILIAVD
ncbi:hypothetical protein GUITHDRAFT_134590 [Guillardia theta CCMP2712]|uniref:Uncharacterized protein n=1 Tax=Guillardia theta (strain CCMP2712) TaxID=905079 RepID=L1JR63_GUITC|nr:hypothetical protein GUITHDRAFT_134590 [Guillardia theta CCMP2712]EKX51056.1 hypothetical protein GUITHDRAFT_134590 [Guillardia theta CCMP2712]|eukprot:XP_005838036.1 hypothetical protein GUITHDRAFT_134590 [Guillardia theta CCMP2712]